jgi:hypothetical protein
LNFFVSWISTSCLDTVEFLKLGLKSELSCLDTLGIYCPIFLFWSFIFCIFLLVFDWSSLPIHDGSGRFQLKSLVQFLNSHVKPGNFWANFWNDKTYLTCYDRAPRNQSYSLFSFLMIWEQNYNQISYILGSF